MLALQSPVLEILGITTVAGNESLERATADALRMLEIANRTDIPVYIGADMPLVHAKRDFAVESYGRWYSDEVVEPPGGLARPWPPSRFTKRLAAGQSPFFEIHRMQTALRESVPWSKQRKAVPL